MDSWNYKNQRIMILAPHADDETIGCGGVIQKYLSGGSPVRVVIASFVADKYQKYKKDREQYEDYCGSIRMAEMKKAFEILGVSDYHIIYLDTAKKVHHHSKLDNIPRYELVQNLERQIQSFNPTTIYIPSVTKHQDHEYLHNAALTATRPYFWNGSVIAYETDGEFSFQPNLYVELTEEEVNKKAQVLGSYQTQLGTEKHPVHPNFIVIKAKYRGQTIYADYAEAFQVVRMHE